ncbi:MAG: ATP synthase F1 subunit epsilon [Prevotella sp.]|nr:ATP synthase F1 subunit epsilon [Prevotella sp.]
MLELKIVSPERVEFDGEVQQVVVPGTLGRFEILNDHAPIISSLEKGLIQFVDASGQQRELNVLGGFVEVQKNQVSVCVELNSVTE